MALIRPTSFPVPTSTYAYDDAGHASDCRSLGVDKAVTAGNLTSDGNGTATVTLSYTFLDYRNQVGDCIQVSGAIEEQYNDVFLVTSATSTGFSFAVPGSPASPATGSIHIRKVINDVFRQYNGPGQMTAEYKSHNGPAGTSPTSTTPAIRYEYDEMPGRANESRLISMTYPNGRVLHYGYPPPRAFPISPCTSTRY